MIGKPIDKLNSINSNELIDIDWHFPLNHKNPPVCQSMTIDSLLLIIIVFETLALRVKITLLS